MAKDCLKALASAKARLAKLGKADDKPAGESKK
jgi:hypothetical protein